MTVKNRKLLAILGSVAVLVVAAALIVVFTGGSSDKPAPDVTDNSGTVSVGDISTPPTDSKEDTVNVFGIEDKTDEPQSSDKPDADPVLNAESGGDVSVNISEFENDKTTPEPPKVKDESALTNPEQKPVYEDNQTNKNPDNDTPKNGDKKPGYIYLEGFGWIKDEGGQAQGEIIDSDGDINKQVGNMG